MSSLLETIRNADDTEKLLVEVPEWGGVKVELRSMSAAARMKLLKDAGALDGETDAAKMYPSMIIATAFDPDTGERLFSPDDESWLMEKSMTALDRLGTAAMQVSGLAPEAVEAGKDGSSTEATSDISTTSPSV